MLMRPCAASPTGAGRPARPERRDAAVVRRDRRSPLADATFARFVARRRRGVDGRRLSRGRARVPGRRSRSAARGRPRVRRFLHVEARVRGRRRRDAGRGLDEAGRARSSAYDRHGASARAPSTAPSPRRARRPGGARRYGRRRGAPWRRWLDGVLAFHSHLRDLAAAIRGRSARLAAIGSFPEGGRYPPTTTPWRGGASGRAGAVVPGRRGVTRDHFGWRLRLRTRRSPTSGSSTTSSGCSGSVARRWRDADEPVRRSAAAWTRAPRRQRSAQRPHSVPTITWA